MASTSEKPCAGCGKVVPLSGGTTCPMCPRTFCSLSCFRNSYNIHSTTHHSPHTGATTHHATPLPVPQAPQQQHCLVCLATRNLFTHKTPRSGCTLCRECLQTAFQEFWETGMDQIPTTFHEEVAKRSLTKDKTDTSSDLFFLCHVCRRYVFVEDWYSLEGRTKDTAFVLSMRTCCLRRLGLESCDQIFAQVDK